MAHANCNSSQCNTNNKCQCPCGPCRVGVASDLADAVANLKGAVDVIKEQLRDHLTGQEIQLLQQAIDRI